MKKTIIILLSLFFLFSCDTSNNYDESDNLEQIKSRHATLLYNDATDLHDKLTIYTYCSGKALINNEIAVSEVNALLNSSTNNYLSYSDIFTNCPNFKDDFMAELIKFILYYHTGIPHGGPRGERNSDWAPDPEKDSNRGPLYNGRYSFLASLIRQELLSEQFTDCIELYFPLPLVLQYETSYTGTGNGHAGIDVSTNGTYKTLYITQHSLTIDNPIGYHLVTENTIETSSLITFDDLLLANNINDILVVRPYRNSQCLYNYINVTNFRDFYN